MIRHRKEDDVDLQQQACYAVIFLCIWLRGLCYCIFTLTYLKVLLCYSGERSFWDEIAHNRKGIVLLLENVFIQNEDSGITFSQQLKWETFFKQLIYSFGPLCTGWVLHTWSQTETINVAGNAPGLHWGVTSQVKCLEWTIWMARVTSDLSHSPRWGLRGMSTGCFCKMEKWYMDRGSFPDKSLPDGELHPETRLQVVLIFPLFLPADPCCSEAALCSEDNCQKRMQAAVGMDHGCVWERGFSICHCLQSELKKES